MCSHRIVMDYIDIDPDRSVQIFYCELCQKTFDKDSISFQIQEAKSDEDVCIEVKDIYTEAPPIVLGEPTKLPPRV